MRLPLEQFKGLIIKAGDTVNLKVVSVGNGEVQFEYVNEKDATPSKEADYIKQPEKPLTDQDDPTTMPLNELRERLPQKTEE